jgi:hypothetical protein
VPTNAEDIDSAFLFLLLFGDGVEDGIPLPLFDTGGCCRTQGLLAYGCSSLGKLGVVSFDCDGRLNCARAGVMFEGLKNLSRGKD